jgi:hypothetical protein
MALYGMTPHPYLIIIVILSAYYGLQFSLGLTALMSGQYMLLLHLQTDYQEVETLITMHYLTFPISLFVIGTIIGEIRTRSQNTISSLNTTLTDKDSINTKLVNKINFLNQESSELKKQLVNKLDTTMSIFQMVQGLNTVDEDELYQNYMEILKNQTGIEAAAIYIMFDETSYKCRYSIEENELDKFPEYQQKGSITDPLLSKCLQTKKIQTVRDITDEKRLLKDVNSVICSPIILDSKLIGYVNITKLPFLQYTPNTFKLISLYTDWLTQSLQHARSFKQLSAHSIVNHNLNTYTLRYFQERAKEEFDQAKRYDLPMSVLKIRLRNVDILEDRKVHFLLKSLAMILNKLSRTTDCIAESDDPNALYVIVSYARRDQVMAFLKRVNEELTEIKQKESTLNQYLQVEYLAAIFHDNFESYEHMFDNLELINVD